MAQWKDSTYQYRRRKRHKFDPWVRKIPEVGNGNPFQYSCLKNSMDRGAWWAAVHGIAESWTRWKQLSTHNHVYESSAYTHTHTHIRFIPLAIALNRFSMLLSGCSHHRRNWLRTFKHLYFSILMFSTRLMVI